MSIGGVSFRCRVSISTEHQVVNGTSSTIVGTLIRTLLPSTGTGKLRRGRWVRFGTPVVTVGLVMFRFFRGKGAISSLGLDGTNGTKTGTMGTMFRTRSIHPSFT